jgi:hemerythrin
VDIYALEVRQLSPAEYKLIEDEHLQLHNSLKNLRNTCRNLDNQGSCKNCSREQIAACQGRLASFFYNFINIATNHFEHEETIMLRVSLLAQDKEDFRSHQRAHTNILNELKSKVSQCALLDARGDTSEAYRQLYNRMSELFEEHERLLDGPYIKSTQP